MLLDRLLQMSARTRALARAWPALLSAALLVTLACTARPDPVEAPPPPPPATPALPLLTGPFEPVPGARELAISRTTCYGTCPDYTAIIDAYGHVWYFGREFAPRRGLHTGRVAPRAVHAVFRHALDSGYLELDDEFRESITDHPTRYTSVALDRRAWVRNYGSIAPPAVTELEAAIDALIAATVWDAQPAVPPAPAHACADLARALAQRCRAYLELRGPRSDCPYFLDHLSRLSASQHSDAERAVQCAAYLRSLAATPNPTAVEPRPKLGRHCTRWAAKNPDACLSALRAGEPHAAPCYRIADEIARMRDYLRPLDIEPDLGPRMLENWCEFRSPPDRPPAQSSKHSRRP